MSETDTSRLVYVDTMNSFNCCWNLVSDYLVGSISIIVDTSAISLTASHEISYTTNTLTQALSQNETRSKASDAFTTPSMTASAIFFSSTTSQSLQTRTSTGLLTSQPFSAAQAPRRQISP